MELISTDPRVMYGQAVLAGTRVPVSVILDCLAVGMTIGEIVAEYPFVTEAGIRAAAYGAALACEELLPLPHASEIQTLTPFAYWHVARSKDQLRDPAGVTDR